MIGTDANTGKALGGKEHCAQSVRDILTTPKGTRVMLRDYGSDLFSLTDRPMNASTKVDMVSATAEAIDLWEPRLRVQSVSIAVNSDGEVTVDVDGIYLPDGTPIRIDNIVVN